MARCKSCGRPIMWIRMNGGVGKPMPCDPLPVPYREDPNGSVVLVTGAGQVVRGYFKGEIEKTPTGMMDGEEVYTDMDAVDRILEQNKAICKAIESIPEVKV